MSLNCRECGALITEAELSKKSCPYCGAILPHVADAKVKAELAKELLADRNGDGVPDMFEAVLKPAQPPAMVTWKSNVASRETAKQWEQRAAAPRARRPVHPTKRASDPRYPRLVLALLLLQVTAVGVVLTVWGDELRALLFDSADASPRGSALDAEPVAVPESRSRKSADEAERDAPAPTPAASTPPSAPPLPARPLPRRPKARPRPAPPTVPTGPCGCRREDLMCAMRCNQRQK
ncbi:MAG: hypothetical protein AAGA56_08280 [Myxococcota bacterium]